MGALKFICPETDVEIESGLDRNPESFFKLPADAIQLFCPYCDQPHLLADVKAWIEGEEHTAPAEEEQAAAA